MNELDLLKSLPKEQFTEYNGKCIQVRSLIKILEKQNGKDANNEIHSKNKIKKILVMGLPGSGKTTLSKVLAMKLNAVHFNADEIRKEINKDLKFSIEDRIEQSRRMKVLCDIVVRSGHYAIADFVCPTKESQEAFITDDTYVVWVDRIKSGRYQDTNKLFYPPKNFDMRVNELGDPNHWADLIMQEII